MRVVVGLVLGLVGGCALAGAPEHDPAEVALAEVQAACSRGPGKTLWHFQVELTGLRSGLVDEIQADLYDQPTGRFLQSFELYREPGTSSWVSEWQDEEAGCEPDTRETTFLSWGRGGARVLGTARVRALHAE